MPGESYCWQLWSLLYLRDIFSALINSLVFDFAHSLHSVPFSISDWKYLTDKVWCGPDLTIHQNTQLWISPSDRSDRSCRHLQMWWWSVKKRWYESAMTFKYCNVASSQRCKVWHLPLLQCAQQQQINQPSFCLCQLAFRTLIITQTCIFHMTLSLISHKNWTEVNQTEWFFFFFFFFKEVNQTEWFF